MSEPALRPLELSAMTLGERAEIALAVWPELVRIADLMNRAASVHDVEIGVATLALSPAERGRIREEIEKRGKAAV